MTVAEMYLRTDNERIVILELNKVLYSGFFDLIEQYYRLCMISYDACKYFHKRAWLLAGEKLHDEIIQFNDSKRFK